MRRFVRVLGLLSLSLAAGCAPFGAVATKTPTDSYSEPIPVEANAAVGGSLFKEDQDAVSNEAMAKILAQKIVLPDRAKLTVVRFGNLPYWWGWSEDFVRTSKTLDSNFLARLGRSPQVSEVAYLPSLVTPTSMALPALRSAAARFQSDLLLVYRTTTHSYQREKVFGPDETRSYCTVEAILLDVRTGLIPFSTVVTEQFAAKKAQGDYDFQETVAKASQQAIAKAWLELADQTAGFLQKQSATAATRPAARGGQ